MNRKVDKSRMTPSVYSDDGDNENESGSDNEEEVVGRGGSVASSRGNRATHTSSNRHKKSGVAASGDGGRSSGDDSSEEEDEDSGSETSEMDVEDCEKRREEYIEDLTELETQFAVLREQLYRERLTQIEAKLKDVKAGVAREYLNPLEELQDNMRLQIDVGVVLRDYRLSNIQCKFEAEEVAAKQNYESEKLLVYDICKAELMERMRRLEEDKNNVDFSTGLWEQNTKRAKKRKYESGDSDRRRKPVTVTGPYIVYMCQESEILEDWTLIKKSLVVQRRALAGGNQSGLHHVPQLLSAGTPGPMELSS